MGAKFGASGKAAIVDINITPFVDIILVVLIIFMLTSSVIAGQQIPVDLPTAASGESAEAPTSLALTLDASGTWHLDGQPTTPEAIKARLTQARTSGEEVICLIGADESVDYGQVVKMVDLVRLQKVSKFALDIKPTSRDPYP